MFPFSVPLLYYSLFFIIFSLFFKKENNDMQKDNPLLDKSLLFAARIVKLNKYLTKEKKETVIAKQIIRSARVDSRKGCQKKTCFLTSLFLFAKNRQVN